MYVVEKTYVYDYETHREAIFIGSSLEEAQAVMAWDLTLAMGSTWGVWDCGYDRIYDTYSVSLVERDDSRKDNPRIVLSTLDLLAYSRSNHLE